MTTTFDTLSRELSELPAEMKMRLALALMESVETGQPATAGEAWATEISRRIADYDSGKMKGVPAAEVFSKLREIAPDVLLKRPLRSRASRTKTPARA